MDKLYNTPTYEQLYRIAYSIATELKDVKKENLVIFFELDRESLRRLDEEYFFKNNPTAVHTDFVAAEVVLITILGLQFKFIEKVDA